MPVPDLSAIAAMTSSLKASADIVKAILGLRDANLVREKANELTAEIMSAQSSALSAQTAQFELIDRVRELEKKIVELEDWNREKQRYELTQYGAALFIYRTKHGMENGEPPHAICATCYQRGRKSLLQQEPREPGRRSLLVCFECGAELFVHGARYTSDAPMQPGRGR